MKEHLLGPAAIEEYVGSPGGEGHAQAGTG
jgi:hypothetical protein